MEQVDKSEGAGCNSVLTFLSNCCEKIAILDIVGGEAFVGISDESDAVWKVATFVVGQVLLIVEVDMLIGGLVVAGWKMVDLALRLMVVEGQIGMVTGELGAELVGVTGSVCCERWWALDSYPLHL